MILATAASGQWPIGPRPDGHSGTIQQDAKLHQGYIQYDRVLTEVNKNCSDLNKYCISYFVSGYVQLCVYIQILSACVNVKHHANGHLDIHTLCILLKPNEKHQLHITCRRINKQSTSINLLSSAYDKMWWKPHKMGTFMCSRRCRCIMSRSRVL